MGAFQDLTNQKFGLLTPIEYFGKSYWLCKCDCGNIVKIAAGHLKNGHTKSCGCINLNNPPHLLHGLRSKPAYRLRLNIRKRCYNENYPRYSEWGGRGITVCDEWNNDVRLFYDYISQLPHFGEKGYSLDRIDNDGNYEPGNVRWATPKEQANNRRKRRK